MNAEAVIIIIIDNSRTSVTTKLRINSTLVIFEQLRNKPVLVENEVQFLLKAYDGAYLNNQNSKLKKMNT